MLQFIICVGYPIWRSYKVVEAKKFDNELIQWLTYWVIHALLTKVEDVLGRTLHFVSVYVFDLGYFQVGFLYKLVKLLIVMWLINPKYQGALLIYFRYLESAFKHREESIRATLSLQIRQSKDGIDSLCRKVICVITEQQASI